MQEATPWIQIALNLIDMMAKNSVKPEVRCASVRMTLRERAYPGILPLDYPKIEESPS